MIASLSYAGDFRMTVGENPNKISNIVGGSYSKFKQLYASNIERSPYIQRDSKNNTKTGVQYQKALPPLAAKKFLGNLPLSVRRKLVGVMPNSIDCPKFQAAVQGTMQSIVSNSSRSQSMKGILTAGMLKSVRYAVPKLLKTIKR